MKEKLPEWLENARLKNAGHRMPSDYFEVLADRVFQKLEAESSSLEMPEELPVFLQDLKKAGAGFSLPDRYFEKQENRVFEKMSARKEAIDSNENQSKTIEIRSKWTVLRRLKWSIAAAAAVGLVAVSVLFFGEKIGPASCETSQCLAQNLTEEDVKAYILENLNEFEAAQLANDESLADLEISQPTKKQDQIDLETEEIESELNRMLDDLSDEDLENVL